MATITEKTKINHLLKRRVVETITEESLRQRLEFGKPLRIKFGADPTAPDLHLGHVVPLKKLREFQDLGHQVVLIIGDYTALIGDPTGKSKTRPMLSPDDIKNNAETYLQQVGKILNRDRLEVKYNSEWFGEMGFSEIIALTARFTVARMIERDDFEKRLKGGVDVHMHELLYPMMQAYDSIMVDADVEIGGTDQRFNMLAGRELQKKMNKSQQDVMLVGPILVGTDGTNKMSKSLGNYIGITDEPNDMFGKIMSVPDDAMWDYYSLVTDIDLNEIAELKKSCADNTLNPRDAKVKLAKLIVTEFHSAESADQAEENFNTVFRQGGKPADITELEIEANEIGIVEALVNAGLAKSNSEARRLVEQGGVKVADEAITDVSALITVTGDGVILQKGKRHFIKLIKKN